MEDMFRAFYQNLPLLNVGAGMPVIGAGMPVIDVAETNDAIEVNAELPGVDEKDIKVSLDGNRLAISGEKKGETKKDEKDWHVEERSYGSFYRSLSLPFKPEDGAIEAHFDKGVLHLNIKKPAEDAKSAKTIEPLAKLPQPDEPVAFRFCGEGLPMDILA
jgi:HSP20 family protein